MKVFFGFKLISWDERGASLVAAAIISFFVALVALTTLALTKAQIESVDDQTSVQQAKLVAEVGLEHALVGLRHGEDSYIPEETEGLHDMTMQELSDYLRDPESNRGVVYDEDPDRTYYSAMEKTNIESTPSTTFETISGDSAKINLTFVDDTTVVRDMKEYDYQKRVDKNENYIVSLGESRRSDSDARSAISGKSFEESSTILERREVQTQAFNENHLDPPYIESEHDSYDSGIDRSWVVSYPNDPSNQYRGITEINVVIDHACLGLGSVGDTLSFSAWNEATSSFDPPFDILAGPITENSITYMSAAPIPTKAIKITMLTDSTDDTANATANYGFKVTGIEYHYDSDVIEACYETPHPYSEIETNVSFAAKPDLIQVIYSPYALPAWRVNPIEKPGEGIVLPWEKDESATELPEDEGSGNLSESFYEKIRLKNVGGNEYQVMRIHFDSEFYIESGDVLNVFNGNTGAMIASYTGAAGANAYTPYAFRSNPDFPLALILMLRRDGNNDELPDPYGYKVDILEYSDENGNRAVIYNPVQGTAHAENIGYNDGMAGAMRTNFVFKPGPPELGGTVANWKVVFDWDADLLNLASDSDRIILRRSAILSPMVNDLYFVTPDGTYGGNIGVVPGYINISELRHCTVDMGTRFWLEIITEFDTENSFARVVSNHGWSISRLEVAYNNAIAIDNTAPRLRSSPVTLKSAETCEATLLNLEYPSFGSEADNRGEWWVNSKDQKQILLHFDLESFRLEEKDAIHIYNENGHLMKLIRPAGYDDSGFTHGGIYDPDNDDTGGGTIEFEFLPNPPEELIESHGWVIVTSDSAQIVLMGDGSQNIGYSGFDIDRIAYWSPVINIRNIMTEFSSDDTDEYSFKVTDPVDKFRQY
jgi:hypothetical protein